MTDSEQHESRTFKRQHQDQPSELAPRYLSYPLPSILNPSRTLPHLYHHNDSTSSNVRNTEDHRKRNNNSKKLKEEFIKHGFDTGSEFRTIKPRIGRWTTEETMYAIKLVNDAYTGRLRTPKRMLVRELLQELLHTTTARVHNKLKGHSVLNYLTLQSEPKSSSTMDWQQVEDSTLRQEELPFSVEMIKAALSASVQELRRGFLESISLTVIHEYTTRICDGVTALTL